MGGGSLKHVLATPYEIYEILTESNYEHHQSRLKLRIGPAGKTGPYATLNIMAQTIDGIVGKRYAEEAAQSLRNNGAIDIPNPTY